MNNPNVLKPEDYLEPNCVLCDLPYGVKEEVKPIPQMRIIEKMDEYMSTQDYTGAERHLKYWLNEALLGNDKRGELMIQNELVGHFRKTQNKEEFEKSAIRAVELLDVLDLKNSLSAGTTYTNIATAYSSFSEDEKALDLFKQAKELYESFSFSRPDLLGGLYNNMGLTYNALGKYDEALELYNKALSIMKTVDQGELEVAITYLNMANTYEAKLGEQEADKIIEELLDKAYECFNSDKLEKNGYYAYVCDKCYPTFEYYGYFIYANELKERMEKIYAGS